jgi:3-oxoadipate enol-lactonase
LSRPRVLLLHGFPLDCRMWSETKVALEAEGWHVSAPDLPGPEAEPNLGAWAEHVLGLAEGPLVPVGVSMGGYLAFELWRQAARRIPALVLADTRATPDTAEQRQGRDDSIRVLREEGFDRFWDGLAPKLFSTSAAPDVVAHARSLAADQETATLVSALTTLRDREDSRPTLATIDVPVLVIVGEEDTLTPPTDAAELEDGIRRARLVRIPGSGHLTPLEAPADFNEAVLAFLEEVTW